MNCPFGEPLVPEGGWRPDLRVGEPLVRGRTLAGLAPPELVEMVRGAERGLIVVGSQPRAEPTVLELAERLDWPVLAEPTSKLRLPGRALAAGQLLMGSAAWSKANRPDVVLQFGAAPTTRATQGIVAQAGQLGGDRRSSPGPRAGWTSSLRIRHRPAEVLPFVAKALGGAGQ